MKKISCIALMLFTMLSCIVFSACGDKFKNLNMTFYNEAGESLNSIHLVIDPNKNLDTMKVGIKVDGIDKKDIGQLTIYSSPAELVEVTNYTYVDNMCYVNISASGTGKGRLVAKHLKSNKCYDTELVVDRKSQTFDRLDDKYIIATPKDSEPDSMVIEHTIDARSLFALSDGATDAIYFKVETTLLAGLETNEIEIDGETYFSTFKDISKNIEGEVCVYPVTYMEGYGVTEYNSDNYKVNINFTRSLEDYVGLKSDNLHDLSKTIYLIENDSTEASEFDRADGEKFAYNYNNLKVAADITDYVDNVQYYDFEVVSGHESILANELDDYNNVLIQAVYANPNQDVEVDFVFTPKVKGSLTEFKKTVKVRSVLRADKIEVKKSNIELKDGEPVDIYDYYTTNNSFGALFNFKAVTNSGIEVFETLSGLQIYVDPEVLSAFDSKGNSLGNVYKDKEFINVETKEVFGVAPNEKVLSSNKYTLEFRLFSNYLRFYYDEDLNVMVSEIINKNGSINNLYLKYVETIKVVGGKPTYQTGEKNLTIDVKTINFDTFNVYKEYPYFQNLPAQKDTINFERKERVTNLVFNAGNHYVDGYGKVDTIKDGKEDKEAKNIYLNRKDEYINYEKDTEKYYVLKLGNVYGNNEKSLSEAEFKIEIESKTQVQNPLTLRQAVVGAGNLDYQELTQFRYQDISSEDLILYFDATTSVGEYTITLIQEDSNGADEFRKSVKVLVYEPLTEGEIAERIELSDYVFENYDADQEKYKYDGYTSNYIAAVGETSQVQIKVNNQDVVNSGIISDYRFELYFDGYDAYEYMSFNEINDNIAELKFKKGTYIEENKYVTLTLKVTTNNYSDILTQSETDNEVSKLLTFFIYERIKDTHISSTSTSDKDKYMYEYLGLENKDKAEDRITIKLSDENLWHYIQGDNDWQFDNTKVKFLHKTDESLYVRFKGDIEDFYETQIKARITQFNEIIELSWKYQVLKPVISEKLILTSDVETNRNGEFYINLKEGEDYKVEAINYSTLGKVSHPGIDIQVVDNTGKSINNEDVISIDRETSSIKVNSASSGYKLLVFAKDALAVKLTGGIAGYDTPEMFLMEDIDHPDRDTYKSAYVEILLELSDGKTKETAFIIDSADDFWAINDVSKDDTYYKVMKDIDLSTALNKEKIKSISDFKGTIFTDGDLNFNLLGINLDNNMENLFTNFGETIENISRGTIENISFGASFDYDYESLNTDKYLGLINESNGTLKNVTLVINNCTITNKSAEQIYFGGLVGKNIGKISYQDIMDEQDPPQVKVSKADLIGVVNTGAITLNGKYVKFGGLVGLNVSLISGYGFTDNTNNGGLSLSVLVQDQGVTSDLVITSNLGTESAVGMVVGLNSYEETNHGKISNIVTVGKITSTKVTSNIGGVAGENESAKSTVTVNATDTAITKIEFGGKFIFDKIKSRVTIDAENSNNIGGIVGLDTYGTYNYCQYQITKPKALKGNQNVGGIAGQSVYGKFKFCSTMSYDIDYQSLTTMVIDQDDNDIVGNDYVGGIVGLSKSDVDSVDKGTSDITDTVVVFYSSVNARIKSLNKVGGILTNDSTLDKVVMFNLYFIGHLYGTSSSSDLYMSYGKVVLNYAYSVLVSDVYNSDKHSVTPYVKDFKTSQIKPEDNTSPAFALWDWTDKLNGDYIYVTSDKSRNPNPIFEIAPTGIKVTVKDNYAVKDAKGDKVEGLIALEYYDFNLTENNFEDNDYNELIKTYNTYKILDLIDIELLPINAGRVRVESSRPDIINVTNNGEFVVKGLGECTITFTPVLNDKVSATITIVVTLPLGDTFVVSESMVDENQNLAGKDLGIAVNTSRLLYIITKGEKITLNERKYVYRTSPNVNLRVEVSNEVYNQFTDKYYLKISGLEFVPDNVNNPTKYYVNVPYTTPLSIRVLQNYENENGFQLTVIPYKTISYNGNTINKDYLKDEDNPVITVKTAVGATDVALSYSKAVLYPNDITIITASFTTDKLLDEYDIEKFIIVTGIDTTEYDSVLDILSLRNISDISNGIQTVKFELLVKEDWFKKEDGEDDDKKQRIDLNIQLVLPNGKVADVDYVILKQRINVIEVKNYISEINAGNTEWLLENVLKPARGDESNGGLLVVDIAPNNGYYDYLEIKDVTGGEEIKFVQVKFDDATNKIINLGELDTPTLDGKGIKLKKFYDADGNEINIGRKYISTQIASNYTSKLHTIEICAYLNDSRVPLATKYYQIQVRMLPSITINLQEPDDSYKLVAKDEEVVGKYLANGMDAEFRIDTENANGEIMFESAGVDEYTLVQDYQNFYKLECNENKETNLGEKVKATFKVRMTQENGDYDETMASIEFTLTRYTAHDISISGAYNDEISGTYGYTGTNLELYFKNTDLSFVENNKESYRHSDSYDENDKILSSIDSILDELNDANSTDGSNLTNFLNYSKLDGTKKTVAGKTISLNETELKVKNEGADDSTYETYVKLEAGKLIVNKDYSDYADLALKVEFGLNLDATDDKFTWLITNDIENANVTISKTFKLNFKEYSSLYEPQLIKNEEEFLNMAAGENMHYVLGVDLTLDNYTPLDILVGSFDGNGRTITINSFAPFESEDIKAGLFANIYPNMLVKNVNVEYVSTDVDGVMSFGRFDRNAAGEIVQVNTYGDLCANKDVNYKSAIFGGIAAVNQGIITNCKVTGDMALNASTIEDKKTANSSGYSIDFKIGELVGTNSETGYITNSDTSMKIYSQANIGGFVYSNAGHITSCEVKNSTIFTYNKNLDKTIEVLVAGFVVENSGEVSMSAVDLSTEHSISASYISAGFVLRNYGEVEDCFVDMRKLGSNNARFDGFVRDNSGSIKTCYTYINQGVNSYNENSMFAAVGTAGLTDCIEIVNDSTYTSSVDGVYTKRISEMNVRSTYEQHNFAFGDNISAVWTINSGNLPKLVSVNEKVRYDRSLDVSYRENEYYCGLQNYKRVDAVNPEVDSAYKFVVDGRGSYGTKENPYVIYNLETWNHYFKENPYGYFRIVADIDFASVGKNPDTSVLTFSGNIQGNNMRLDNILLKSTDSLGSIGLFRNMESADDITVKNSVRNLRLSTMSIWAVKTSAVGMLTGIAEDFNFYNIHIDSPNEVVVGGNAVGGMIGVVRGEFDIQKISSNVGVNSTIPSGQFKYSVYMSKNNNKDVSYNLSNVYYAGSVIGILDGYSLRSFDINDARDINSYVNYKVKDVYVYGAITSIADFAGSAFGFIGERVVVEDVEVNIEDAIISGAYYAGGLAGENRGYIANSQVFIEGETAFDNSQAVCGGVVGLNLGGLVYEVTSQVNILNSNSQSVVGGVVGRNINGTIAKVTYSGELVGYFTGGITGADYFVDPTNTISDIMFGHSNPDAMSKDCILDSVVPDKDLKHYNGVEIKKYSNCLISVETIEFYFENSKKFMTFRAGKTDINEALRPGRVFGLFVGISNCNNAGVSIDIVDNYGMDSTGNYFGLNEVIEENKYSIDTIGTVQVAEYDSKLIAENPTFALPYSKIETNITTDGFVYFGYAIGNDKISTFDAWERLSGYSEDYFVFADEEDVIEFNLAGLNMIDVEHSVENNVQEYVFTTNSGNLTIDSTVEELLALFEILIPLTETYRPGSVGGTEEERLIVITTIKDITYEFKLKIINKKVDENNVVIYEPVRIQLPAVAVPVDPSLSQTELFDASFYEAVEVAQNGEVATLTIETEEMLIKWFDFIGYYHLTYSEYAESIDVTLTGQAATLNLDATWDKKTFSNYIHNYNYNYVVYDIDDAFCQYEYVSKSPISTDLPNNMKNYAFTSNMDQNNIRSFAVDTAGLTEVEDVEYSDQLVYVLERGMKPICKPGSIAETIYNNAKEVLMDICADSDSDYEKAKAIYEWLVLNVTYDHNAAAKSKSSPFESYDAFYAEGVFNNGNNREAVCDGIAKAYLILSRIEGVECYQVDGFPPSGAGHAWNQVKINNNYYIVDATWGNVAEMFIRYNQFLCTTDFQTSQIGFGSTDYNLKPSAAEAYDYYKEYKPNGTDDLYVDNHDDVEELIDYAINDLNITKGYIIVIETVELAINGSGLKSIFTGKEFFIVDTLIKQTANGNVTVPFTLNVEKGEMDASVIYWY